jgi:hypothetical protein
MESYGERLIRCPRLGGEVPFSYCEREAGDLPCRQVVRCWAAGFPVEAYLRETLGPEAWERFCAQVPKDRLTTLLGLAEAARRRRPKER